MTIPERALESLTWLISQLQGDSGTGDTYWSQFQEYRSAIALRHDLLIESGPDITLNSSVAEAQKSELARTQELFEFLRGTVPDRCRYKKSHQPKLTANQAWLVIWWLGNQYWQVPDFINRCCVCGDLYDSESEGDCLDYGKAPYHFCNLCMQGESYEAKRRQELPDTKPLRTA